MVLNLLTIQNHVYINIVNIAITINARMPLSPISKSRKPLKFLTCDGIGKNKKVRNADHSVLQQDFIFAYGSQVERQSGDSNIADWDDNVDFGVNNYHLTSIIDKHGYGTRSKVKCSQNKMHKEALVLSDSNHCARNCVKDSNSKSHESSQSVYQSRKNNQLRIDIPKLDSDDAEDRLPRCATRPHIDDTILDVATTGSLQGDVVTRPPSGASAGTYTKIRDVQESGHVIETVSTIQDLQLTSTPTVKRPEETPTGLFLLAAHGLPVELVSLHSRLL